VILPNGDPPLVKITQHFCLSLFPLRASSLVLQAGGKVLFLIVFVGNRKRAKRVVNLDFRYYLVAGVIGVKSSLFLALLLMV
jgi:hypothetical protein